MSAVAADAAAAAFPSSSWAMLERFVFRRDDESSFPDASDAPLRARMVKRCQTKLIKKGLPGPEFKVQHQAARPAIVRRLRRLALFAAQRIAMPDDMCLFYCYSIWGPWAAAPLALPQDRPWEEEKKRRRSLMTAKSMGILCQGGSDQEEEFAVVEMMLFKPSRFEVYADIFLLRSSSTSSSADELPQLGGEWTSMRVPIHVINRKADDTWQLCLWQTDTVIPFGNKYLCWVDYYRGILFLDVFGGEDPTATPTVSFLRFPLDAFPDTHIRSHACSWLYRCVTAIDGNTLKFVDVARDDGVGYGALKLGAGFTVTCHTLHVGSGRDNNNMVWSQDCTFTSGELWSANPPERLPRCVLMFPQVDVDWPHVVHFVVSEFKYVMKKIWVVSVDMRTKTVESS
ncbi:hypothetical protein EJB05_15270, partial [Eragrostis curvula]